MSYTTLVEAVVKIKEGIFDTEIFKSFQKKFGADLPKLSDEERKRINVILGAPTALIIEDGDVTFENWFLRISTWGPIKITHKNPEERINRTISPTEFIKYIDDQQRNASCGVFDIEEVKLNKIRFYRKFYDIKGKEVTEEIFVDIDWRPEVKAQIQKIRKGIKL